MMGCIGIPISPLTSQNRGSSHSSSKRDRKSTRLNSSHGYISYAVFCLKKKKTRVRNNNYYSMYTIFSQKKKLITLMYTTRIMKPMHVTHQFTTTSVSRARHSC